MKIILDRLRLQKLWYKEITIQRSDFLKMEGSIDTNLYLIDEGSLRFFIRDEEEEKTIRFGYRGELVAVLDSYISLQASPLIVQAIKKAKIKVIRKVDFESMIKADPVLVAAWEKLLGALILQCMEREIDILTKSPQDRYNRVVQRSPRLFQEIPNKYIASYLNMTPETLSRIKKS